MNHPLDNPIWNALNTGSSAFSFGTADYRLINREMGFFAGLLIYDEASLSTLHAACESGQKVILFTPEAIPSTEGWLARNDRELLQMVFVGEKIEGSGDSQISVLQESHIPAMLELTEMTKPGPFLKKTIDFGGYHGVFEGNQLASMAGFRLAPDPYVEVSAVCTHPDFLGQGLSGKVMKRVMSEILDSGRTPFLHVYPDNFPAIKVYERLGFEARKTLRVYFLEKE